VFGSAIIAFGNSCTTSRFKCPAARIASSTYFLFGTSVSFTGGSVIVRLVIAYPAAASSAAIVFINESLNDIVPSLLVLKYEASSLFK